MCLVFPLPELELTWKMIPVLPHSQLTWKYIPTINLKNAMHRSNMSSRNCTYLPTILCYYYQHFVTLVMSCVCQVMIVRPMRNNRIGRMSNSENNTGALQQHSKEVCHAVSDETLRALQVRRAA